MTYLRSWDCHGGVPPRAGVLKAWTENGVPYRSSGKAARVVSNVLSPRGLPRPLKWLRNDIFMFDKYGSQIAAREAKRLAHRGSLFDKYGGYVTAGVPKKLGGAGSAPAPRNDGGMEDFSDLQ